MVFESLLNPQQAESKPFEMFFYGLIITSVSLWAAYYIFPSASSVVFLFLVTIAALPTITKILQDEEEIDEMSMDDGLSFFERHERAILVYSYLFMGVLVAVSFWYSFLPDAYRATLFDYQVSAITAIRGAATGAATGGGMFSTILFNNLKVTFIAFMMSFFFGTGAIFILTWNASVIGVFISRLAVQFSSEYSYSPLRGHFDAFFAIALHGIPEMVAYFIAGIAGGILSIGMIRGKQDAKIMRDAFMLFGISVLVLVMAAGIETWITPNL